MDRYLTLEDTKLIKGIAVILMLMHHLWYWPGRLAGSALNCFIGAERLIHIGEFGKICVSLFFFVGGYGIYLSSNGKSFDLIRRLKKIYFAYWKVFLIFIPIGFIFFHGQPIYCGEIPICTRFDNFSSKDILLTFLGLEWSYNAEWWFFRSYVIAVVTFPFLRYIIDKSSVHVNLLLVICSSILVTTVLPAIGEIEELGCLNQNHFYSMLITQDPYVVSFWMGAVCARNGLLERLNNSICKQQFLNPVTDIIIIYILYFLRRVCGNQEMDIFIVPLFIIVSKNLVDRLHLIRRFFLAMGKESTNMWLIHTFFCYYYYAIAKIILAPRWALASLILLTIATYAASIATDFIWNKINFLFLKTSSFIKSHQKSLTSSDD